MRSGIIAFIALLVTTKREPFQNIMAKCTTYLFFLYLCNAIGQSAFYQARI